MSEFRKLKAQFKGWLVAPDWQDALLELEQHPPARLVGPLFSFLLHDGALKWHSVTALGLTIARMAEERLEDARVVMRRLIWNLSEESGNLGWGAPETMGEILAVHGALAQEYHRILISYITETGRDDNYIDHLPLRRGAFWGVGRLAQARPELAAMAAPYLRKGLEQPTDSQGTPDAVIHGLAAWGLGLLADAEARPLLEKHRHNQAELELYRDRVLEQTTVAVLAHEALEALEAQA
jgi:hypothetical protein